MTEDERKAQQAERIDPAFLRRWIGREQQVEDVITPRVVDGLRATLGPEMASSERLPASLHWCLAPETVPQSDLGADGHAIRGDFLPPVPLPRRMWAASDVEFLSDFALMDTVVRHSRIDDVELKAGRSGPLIFVTVRHEWSTSRGAALRELQKIVYRAAGAPAASPPVQENEAPAPDHRQMIAANEALLFRYSSLTFNAHRIHYDRRYATEVEGYSGLLVHGPLQASMLLEFAAALHGNAQPRRFSFRAVGPLFDGQSFTVNASKGSDRFDLWCANAGGGVTMQATAEWT